MSRTNPYDENVYLFRDGSMADSPEVLEIKSAKQEQFAPAGEENNWRTLERATGQNASSIEDIEDGTTPVGKALEIDRGGRWKLAAPETITNNVWTTVPYDTEEYNTDSGLFELQGSGTVKVLETGIYMVVFSTRFAAANTGFRRMRGYLGGTQKCVDVNNFVNASTPTAWTSTMMVQATANQQIQHQVNQNSGSDLDLDAAESTTMAIARL